MAQPTRAAPFLISSEKLGISNGKRLAPFGDDERDGRDGRDDSEVGCHENLPAIPALSAVSVVF